jgi:Fe-coproporphyrin III synthase
MDKYPDWLNGEQYEGVNCSSRIVHVHPTLRCNLSCKHCYSSSLPSHKTTLDLEELKAFLEYAYGEGYNTISVSGGEPFLYQDLKNLLVFTKSIGYKNVVASNGMLLNTKKAQDVFEYINVIALSIDGKPGLHNKIRGSATAFDKMVEGVEVLRKNNKKFGFIHTVTSENWEDLIWMGEFSKEKGATLLQLHPLEMFGRAKTEMHNYSLGQDLFHKIFILASYLKIKHEHDFFLQLDFLHKDFIKEFPTSVNLFPSYDGVRKLSEILNIIIVNENGDIVPIGYGFSKKYQIGNIKNLKKEKSMFDIYKQTRLWHLIDLFKRTYNHILENANADLINWNELIIDMSNH